MAYALAIHGGAGFLVEGDDPERDGAMDESLQRILAEGQQMLASGRGALDVVEQMVIRLEDDPLYNAGYGAVLTRDGRIELDATIMDGGTREAGGVGNITAVSNPVRLARAVMAQTTHLLLAGPDADRFAADVGLPTIDAKTLLTPRREAQWRRRQEQAEAGGGRAGASTGETVGAVARDQHGHLASATSTGGRDGQMSGRIGDSAIIGAGTYADDRSCAVSGTGYGEAFIRAASAASVHLRLRMNESVRQAVDTTLTQDMPAQSGGMIAVDAAGNVVWQRTTSSMPVAIVQSNGRFTWKIWGDDASYFPIEAEGQAGS